MTADKFDKKYGLTPDDFIYSPYAIDYSHGVTKREDGVSVPNKLGAFVLKISGVNKIMKVREAEENETI
jgi:hypothetical protein